MGKLLLALCLLAYITTTAQIEEPKTYFSEVLGKNIRKYRVNAKRAYAHKDLERAQFLFDSLIEYVIKDSYIDNFKVRKFSGKKIELHQFEKPIYLITYATWCTPGIGEVPALNDVVDANYKEIDFVMLFWGSKKKIRKLKKKFNSNIKVLYVDEKENNNDFVIRYMKHTLGFPTSFFISKDKKILDVKRNFLHHYSEDYSHSYTSNYQAFTGGVAVLKGEEVEK
ncbi:MAG: redoxin domain-containing protein [Flavobacteriaceae bacterium]